VILGVNALVYLLAHAANLFFSLLCLVSPTKYAKTHQNNTQNGPVH
jgi:hypothetical protein